MDRIEFAWEKLKNWANEFHFINSKGYFVGTNLGPVAEFYFPDSPVKLVNDLFKNFPATVENLSIAQISQDLIESELSSLSALGIFLTDHLLNLIILEVTVSIKDFKLELNVILEKSGNSQYDLRISWRPVIAFYNCSNLKERFFNIFNFIFLIGRKLNKNKVIFNTQVSTYQKKNLSRKIEI